MSALPQPALKKRRIIFWKDPADPTVVVESNWLDSVGWISLFLFPIWISFATINGNSKEQVAMLANVLGDTLLFAATMFVAAGAYASPKETKVKMRLDKFLFDSEIRIKFSSPIFIFGFLFKYATLWGNVSPYLIYICFCAAWLYVTWRAHKNNARFMAGASFAFCIMYILVGMWLFFQSP